MTEQLALPSLDWPTLVPGPVVVCFELKGVPGHKARHRSRIVFPKEKWKKAFIHNYPDPATAAYEETLKQVGHHFMAGRPPVEGPVALLVHSFRPVPASWSGRDTAKALAGAIQPTSRPDWDDYGKITDALNDIVWKDDAQVTDGRVIKRYSDSPGLRVEVREFVAR